MKLIVSSAPRQRYALTPMPPTAAAARRGSLLAASTVPVPKMVMPSLPVKVPERSRCRCSFGSKTVNSGILLCVAAGTESERGGAQQRGGANSGLV